MSASTSEIEAIEAVIVEQPTRIRVVGCGDVAVAIGQLARVLRWDCSIVDRLDDRDDLDQITAVVVLSHDVGIAGYALRRGLSSEAAYVGAMGSRSTQRERRDWLLGHQVDEHRIEKIYGPAGLDIGAQSPPEIALSIMAEISAIMSGTSGQSISRRDGSVHRNSANGPAGCPGG